MSRPSPAAAMRGRARADPPDPQRRNHVVNPPGWLGALLVLLAASLFGSLGVASRWAYDAGVAPLVFVAWRAVFGAIGLWLLVLVIRRPSGIRAQYRLLDGGGRRWLLLAVALAAGVNATTFLAFDLTTVALALLGFYTYPAMVAVGVVLLGREPMSATRALAVVLALGGMAAVVLGGPAEAAGATAATGAIGVGLALLGALFQSTWFLTSRNYAALAADQAMATTLAGCAVVGLVSAVAVDGAAALAFPFERPELIGLLVLVGLFAAALPSTLLLLGIRWIGGVRTGILMLFEPVVGVVLAALLLAEGLQPLQVAGGATILLAAFLVQRASSARIAPTDPVAIAPAPGGP
jgi:drug/metabolite transporter (DMT)-like permease